VVKPVAKMTTAKVGGGCSICKGFKPPQESCNNQLATSNKDAKVATSSNSSGVSSTAAHEKGADSKAVAASQATSATANK